MWEDMSGDFEGVVDHAMVLERFVKRSTRKEWMAHTARWGWVLQTTGREGIEMDGGADTS